MCRTADGRSTVGVPVLERPELLALLRPVASRFKAVTPVTPGVVASITGADDAAAQLQQ
jgi:hypothetical protein